jgi:zona occludens toxin
MLVLVTGLPGNGKTLYALSWVKAKAEKENRPVYYSGIADLKLPWTEFDPEKWMDCPPNSIIVIDEAQRVYRPRMHGVTVPAHVSALETHRHKGVDIVLITQHPMLVDTNVRRLAGLHFHLVRKFGMAASTVHEWASVKDNCDKNRSDSTRHDFVYPKGSYDWYKSAEVHTHKARIPARVFVLLALPVFIITSVALGWRWFKTSIPGAEVVTSASGAASAPGLGARAVASGKPAVAVDPVLAYAEQFQARIPGLSYTAPVYDEVTQVKHAPYPAACIAALNRCTCYTQQGTKLADVNASLCAQIVSQGFFVAWDLPPPPERPTPAPASVLVTAGDRGGTPQVVSALPSQAVTFATSLPRVPEEIEGVESPPRVNRVPRSPSGR